MKRYILIFCILSVFCTSCIWERGDKDRRPTQRGKEIHECWFSVADYVLNSSMQTAFYLNAWLAADSVERIAIEDQYFPYQRIRIDENGNYQVYKGEQLVGIINTHQTLLSDIGSAWEVSHMDDGELEHKYGFYGGCMTVNCVENGCWEISSDWPVSPEDYLPVTGDTISWKLRLTAAATPMKLSETPYQLEGTGDASAIVAHRHDIVLDGDLDSLAMPLHKLVDGVVDDLFEEHVDTVVVGASVAQLADIHAGTEADMFIPFEGDNVGVVVIFSHFL